MWVGVCVCLCVLVCVGVCDSVGGKERRVQRKAWGDWMTRGCLSVCVWGGKGKVTEADA